jgi:hypothetical protein
MGEPLSATRRVKENRFFQNRIEIEPPATPPLPGAQVAARNKMPIESRYILEQDAEIRAFMNEQGPAADGVRRVIMAVKSKRKELETEWDVRGAMARFVQEYQVAVPKADPEYIRGMKLALKVYLGSTEAQK